MLSTFYHCDKCGNEISTQCGMDQSQITPCECGGSYKESDDPIICPECRSTNIEPDPAGFWD